MNTDTTSPDSDALSDQDWLESEAKRLAEIRNEFKPAAKPPGKMRFGDRHADAPSSGMPYSVVRQGRTK